MVGTITFHWATNYGAVLQSYSLQQYLIKNDIETEIINYTPMSVIFRQYINWKKNNKKYLFIREKKLGKFRNEYLRMSKRVFFSRQLKQFRNKYCDVITGSDQVWNNAFTLSGEFRPTLSYFLDFVGEKTNKIAYATSFGSVTINQEYIKLVAPKIMQFANISVREQSGIELVKKLGRDSIVVCDPTLLLEKEDYFKLFEKYTSNRCNLVTRSVFSYVLHDDNIAQNCADYVRRRKESLDIDCKEDGLEEWLFRIYNSEIVVTNSFHGVMMSLIFNKPFIAVLILNSEMNDRIITILKNVDLQSRIIDDFNEIKLDQMITEQIDWEKVNYSLKQMQAIGSSFLRTACIKRGDNNNER